MNGVEKLEVMLKVKATFHPRKCKNLIAVFQIRLMETLWQNMLSPLGAHCVYVCVKVWLLFY